MTQASTGSYMTNDNVLWLTEGKTQMEEASALTEYDVVIADASWNIFRRNLATTDETPLAVPLGLVALARTQFDRRRDELTHFLTAGGILILRLLPPVLLLDDIRQASAIDSYDWFVLPAFPSGTGVGVTPSEGAVRVLDRAHALAPYIESLRRHRYVLPRNFGHRDPESVVIAANRGNEPIAVEFRARGRVLVVAGTDGDPATLEEGVRALMLGGRRAAQIWQPPILEELDRRELAAHEALADELREVSRQRLEQEARLTQQLSRTEVAKTISFYTAATTLTGDARRIAHELYSMFELIKEQLVPKGERIWNVLPVTESDVRAFTRFANDTQYQTRHVSLAHAEPNLTPVQALAIGERILHAYLERLHATGAQQS
jgi:hypothetical protein